MMVRYRPSWKERIWSLKEITCIEDHKKEAVQKKRRELSLELIRMVEA